MPRYLALLLVLLFSSAASAADSQFFESNGVKIHYQVEGKGEPVLLVHGFAVNIPMQWSGTIKALSKDYQVIALDNRGHGRSGKPRDPQQYGREMVEDIVRLLDHLKISKAHVVGYSLGAFITLKLLTTHPDRLLTATLGGAGLGDKSELGFLDELANSIDDGKGFGPLIIRLNPPGRPKPTEAEIKVVSQFLSSFNDSKALAAVIRGMKELEVQEAQLRVNTVPTLALIGDQDPLKTGVEALRGKLPHLRVIVISGADHLNAFAQPQFTRALREFLAEHASRRVPAGVSGR